MRIRPLLEKALLTALPDGGQVAARRNAWSAMSQDAVHARARRDARAALAAAHRRARRAADTGT
jgi:hypothetical protein